MPPPNSFEGSLWEGNIYISRNIEPYDFSYNFICLKNKSANSYDGCKQSDIVGDICAHYLFPLFWNICSMAQQRKKMGKEKKQTVYPGTATSYKNVKKMIRN